MKIRTRLTLSFTIITALLLGSYSFFMHYSSKNEREKSFYKKLEGEALAKADLFFQSSLTGSEMHNMYKNNYRRPNRAQTAIYNSNYQLIYHDDITNNYVEGTSELIAKIFSDKEIKFFIDKLQVIGITYNYNGKTYAIIAVANDQFGYANVSDMFAIGISTLIFGLVLTYLCGIFFSKRALSPISDMINQTKNITAGNLQLRLNVPKEKDELGELSESFNNMLERLENSFNAQKSFVSNISHELRTPLSAIIAELSLVSVKNLTKEQYQQIILRVLKDSRNMAKLSSSLMDLAKASYDPKEISFTEIRVDEILLESYLKVKKKNPEYKININISDSLEEYQLILCANAYLLQVAFSNLIVNACKYSFDYSCFIDIFEIEGKLYLTFTNTGNTILEEDLQNIFKPFFRSNNYKNKEGHGIGLFLVEKITRLHQADITVVSKDNKTMFTILFHKYSIE